MVVNLISAGSWAIVIWSFCNLVKMIWLKEREIRWRTAGKKHHRRAMRQLSEDNTRNILRLRRSPIAPGEADG